MTRVTPPSQIKSDNNSKAARGISPIPSDISPSAVCHQVSKVAVPAPSLQHGKGHAFGRPFAPTVHHHHMKFGPPHIATPTKDNRGRVPPHAKHLHPHNSFQVHAHSIHAHPVGPHMNRGRGNAHGRPCHVHPGPVVHRMFVCGVAPSPITQVPPKFQRGRPAPEEGRKWNNRNHPAQQVSKPNLDALESQYDSELKYLNEKGFTRDRLNLRILLKNQGDVEKTLQHLSNHRAHRPAISRGKYRPHRHRIEHPTC